MKRFLLLAFLVAASPASAQYLDGLPVAGSVSSTDILPLCQGSNGTPGTCTTRRATVGQIQLGSLFNQSINLGTGSLTAAGAVVTGNATIGGTLGVTGAINTNGLSGFEQNGSPVFNTLPVNGFVGNGWTLIGKNAGLNIGNVAIGLQAVGYESGGSGGNTIDGMGGGTGMLAGATESTFNGAESGTQITSGYWITATGHNTAGHEVDGYQSEYYGTDGGKYALHDNNQSGYGFNDFKYLWNSNQNVALGGNTFTGGFEVPSITGTANNGSGAIRLTVSSAAGMTTNDAVFVEQVGGTVEANTTGTPWYITVIDGTHIDLQGSTYVHPFVSGGNPSVNDFTSGFVNQAVTGATNNGSGVIRLTVGNTVGMQYPTGTIHVAGVAGTTEANGTWTYNLIDAACTSGGCRIDLTGSTFVHAYTSGGQATVLDGPTANAIVGNNSLNSQSMTGGIVGVTGMGSGILHAAKNLSSTTVLGEGIGPTLLGSTGANTNIILIGVGGEDVASASVNSSVGIGPQIRLANSSTQVGYRAGFQNNINGSASSLALFGRNTGFSITGGVDISAFGDSVASVVCTTAFSVLLLGTNQSTDCTSATENHTIHIGAGAGDIIYATGAGTPATSALTLPSGTIKLSNAFATNGSVATVLTSLGPTGSHTTVQEWLTFTDGNGVVRYIPAF